MHLSQAGSNGYSPSCAESGSLNCIDLFAGAGGLSLGLEVSGFEAVAAVECDHDCCQTYDAFFPKLKIQPLPIEAVDFTAFSGIELVAGGPPCQPFSIGGKRLSAEDSRDMLPHFVRAVAEARPQAFLLENVPGLCSSASRDYFESVLKSLGDLGYAVSWKVLNAADYGVPQKRRRLFVVGLKGTEPFNFPVATHGPKAKRPFEAAAKYVDPPAPVGQPNPSKVVYAKNPDLRPSPYDGHLFNGGGRPIDLSQPSHTILASAGGNKTHFLDTCGLVPPYHRHLMQGGEPRQGQLQGARRLTVAESAALQTFPKGARFFGSRSSQYTQVGNAVPPRLAAVLGEAIAKALA